MRWWTLKRGAAAPVFRVGDDRGRLLVHPARHGAAAPDPQRGEAAGLGRQAGARRADAEPSARGAGRAGRPHQICLRMVQRQIALLPQDPHQLPAKRKPESGKLCLQGRGSSRKTPARSPPQRQSGTTVSRPPSTAVAAPLRGGSDGSRTSNASPPAIRPPLPRRDRPVLVMNPEPSGSNEFLVTA